MKLSKNKKYYHMTWILLSIIAIIIIGTIVFINQPRFGRLPQGVRKEKIVHLPNYRDGKIKNLSETKQITSEKGFIKMWLGFLFDKTEDLKPDKNLPTVKTDLWNLNRQTDVLIWFGHSSCFIQLDGKRILIDPVFGAASPVSFFNKPFNGADIYTPDDIPEIDCMIITHDHWDHLDYKTVIKLKDRTKKIICGLGVGEHFEHWGFDMNRIVELAWNDEFVIGAGFTVYCLPARHFSGRGLSPNQSLWASFLLQTPSQKIYISGDSGYDTHFAEIGNRFGTINLAILENGQYSENWKYIHTMPEQIILAFRDLKAEKLLTVHHSKYAMGQHSWKEPPENISKTAEKDSINLLIPMIGEVVYLKDSNQKFEKWWIY